MLQEKVRKLFESRANHTECRLLAQIKPLLFSSDILFKKEFIFSSNNYRDELLDPNCEAQDTFRIFDQTYLQKDSLLFDSMNLSLGLFVLEPGFLGREYNKTTQLRAMTNNSDRNVLFQVIDGNGFIMLENQNRKKIRIIKIESSNYVLIPKKHNFTVINSNSENKLICLYITQKGTEFISKDNSFGVSIFYTKSGFAKNKMARRVFEIEDFIGDYIKGYYFDKERSLYQQFLDIPEKFNFLKK